MAVFMQVLDVLGIVVNALVAVIVIREGRRAPLGLPGMALFLSGYFVARSLAHVFSPNNPLLSFHSSVAAIVDSVALIFAIGFLFYARRVVDAISKAESTAKARAHEYERARHDYTMIVRHRMMNPLAVIEGAARTLRANPTIDAQTQSDLLRAIVDCAVQLKHTTLEPEHHGIEEQELDAVPHVA